MINTLFLPVAHHARRGDLDKADSTFVVRAPLSGKGCVSLESVNFPGYFLRQDGGQVRSAENDGTDQFAADATF